MVPWVDLGHAGIIYPVPDIFSKSLPRNIFLLDSFTLHRGNAPLPKSLFFGWAWLSESLESQGYSTQKGRGAASRGREGAAAGARADVTAFTSEPELEG